MRPRGKRNVYLIGFMASGKTTLGKALAKKLGWRFADTDATIEARGRTIARIFAEDGEPRFRALESRAIERVSRVRRQVVAVGGGAVLARRNVQAMKKSGCVVYCRTPFDVIVARAERGGLTRPLWRGKTRDERRRAMAQLYAIRRPLYRKAAHVTVAISDAERLSRRLAKDGWIEA